VVQRGLVRYVLCLLLPLIMTGCDREGQFPTAVSPPTGGDAPPNLGARDEDMSDTMRGRDHQNWTHRAIIAEAKEALLVGVATGELVYYQQYITFIDVADTADFRVKLGVVFGDMGCRWAFSVSGASVTGFVAQAQGRDDTKAEGITVTLSYQRGQPIVWTVENARRRRHGPDHTESWPYAY
jgi:hypothetical protein